MTAEEALELLKEHKGKSYIKEPAEFEQALEVGIQAIRLVLAARRATDLGYYRSTPEVKP